MAARTGTSGAGLRAGLMLLAAAVVGALGAVVTAAPAAAHAELVSSDPAHGRAVGSLPAVVTLTFSEAVRAPAFVEVTAPDGTDVATGGPRIVDEELTQRLRDSAAGGRYTLSYRITSADGHPVTGSVQFTVRGGDAEPAAPTGTAGGGEGSTDEASEPPASAPQTAPQPSPAAAEDEPGGISTTQLLLLLALLAVGLLAVGIGTRRALRRSTTMVEDRSRGRSSRR